MITLRKFGPHSYTISKTNIITNPYLTWVIKSNPNPEIAFTKLEALLLYMRKQKKTFLYDEIIFQQKQKNHDDSPAHRWIVIESKLFY